MIRCASVSALVMSFTATTCTSRLSSKIFSALRPILPNPFIATFTILPPIVLMIIITQFSEKQKKQTSLLVCLFEFLASKMRKSSVRFCHSVAIFLFLEGSTSLVISINDFELQALSIRHTTPRSRRLY